MQQFLGYLVEICFPLLCKIWSIQNSKTLTPIDKLKKERNVFGGGLGNEDVLKIESEVNLKIIKYLLPKKGSKDPLNQNF